MKNFLFFILLIAAIYAIAGAGPSGTHPKRNCKTLIPSAAWEQSFSSKVQALNTNQALSRTMASYTIPVVVHVVYWTATQNISQAQVNSQIQVLNDDYKGTGLNANTCPTPFKPLIADCNISFCLAQKAPNGSTLSQPGIDRVDAQARSFRNPGTSGWGDSYIDGTIKPATIWDPTKYMNIWVVPLEDGELGYATFPRLSTLQGLDFGGDAQTDGVVIGYLYFGNTGTVEAPYDKGRTTTHEVGHWLGLRHISGDVECGEDYCADTPTQSGNAGDGSGLNYGCPTYPFQVNGCSANSSPNGELFMDFMDYTDDACMFMFTPNQRTRMQTTMANGTYRLPLTVSTVCNVTAPTAVASFTVSDTVVCPGGSLTFTNASTANTGSPDSVRWLIPGGTPSTSVSSTTVSPVFSAAGTYTISLVAYKGGVGSVAFTKTIRVKAKPTVTVNSPSTCAGQTATLTASGATTYTWSNSLGSTASVTTPALTTTTTYTVTGTLSGCTNTAVSTVTVKTRPSVTVNSPAICSGKTASLTAGGATTYVWSSSLGAASTVTTPALTSSTTYTVTGTTNGCTNTAVSTVTVNANPTVTATSSSICSGKTASLTAGGATAYVWSNSLGTSATTTTPALTSTTTYTVTGTTNGCTNTAVSTVTVKPNPSVTANSPGICSGQSASLTASGASSYVWSNGLGTNPTATTPSLSATTSYTVTGTTNGCTGTAVSTVTVNTTAPTVVITPNPASVCQGNSITLTASGANNYTWNQGGATGNTLTFTPSGTLSVNVSGTLIGCAATGQSSVTVTVKPNPAVSVNSPSICSGQTASLTATGGSTYSWSNGLGSNATATTPVLSSTTNYTVTGTVNGCTSTAVAVVSVSSVPSTPSVIQSHDTLRSSVTGSQYTWYYNGTSLSTTSVPYLKITQNGAYKVEVTNSGCTSAQSLAYNAVMTGIQNNRVEWKYSVLPNPNNGSFEIRFSAPSSKQAQIKLFSVSGQLILSEDMNTRVGENFKFIDLAGIEKGIYFLSIITDDGVGTQNIMVQ